MEVARENQKSEQEEFQHLQVQLRLLTQKQVER
jgi:hypothetical protein